VGGDLAAPFFARWLEPEQASRAAEWAVRLVLAYCSDPAPDTDLSHPDDTRALVRAFVLPGILALRTQAPRPARSTTRSHRPRSSTRPTRLTTKGAAQ
jgi:hypothetical protein